jgi:glycosyltransferase involved in cell wall biosynthesis
MYRLKIIILYNKIFHYRIPVWNELAKLCDLTVTYSEGDGNVPDNMEANFKIMHLPVSRIKGIVLQKTKVRKLCRNYDAVIAYGNIAWLKYSTLPWFNKIPVIYHTIGVSASYGKGFDEHKEWDRVRNFFYSKADALAFYTDYPIQKYEKLGIPREKMFVAPNTVAVSPIKEAVKKDTLLVIGTLYREKGIQSLLDVYKELRPICKLPMLNIIGKGPDYDLISKWIQDNNMQDLIILRGAIYDINVKAKYFAQALACISPKQAGLTVLESMGYGVPFVSTKNAITGGELLNVHNGVDGVVMNSENDLSSVVKDISDHPEKYITMGEKAKEFYDNNRTPMHMAQGFWDAIQYVMRKK